MKISNFLVRRLATLLRIPDDSIRMLLAASDLSGLERKSLPSELIPLNSIQISRGVLNYVVMQGLHGWVFPYAFEHQLNPDDPCFVPRAHLSVAMNVTRRNWTGIGNPDSEIEPIVDPRGLLTFAPNGWSLDFWFRLDHATFFASRLENVQQRLVNGDPIVETTMTINDITIILTAYTSRDLTFCQVDVDRRNSPVKNLDLIAAVRPFNPEGASLIHTLSYENTARALQVNDGKFLRFSRNPSRVVLSTFDDGDVAQLLQRENPESDASVVNCSVGLATGALVFPITEIEESPSLIVTWTTGIAQPTEYVTIADEQKRWVEYRQEAMTLDTPDANLNVLFRASLSTVLQLTDSDSISPGPFTYHQFWFRDAAAMLLALDRAGCTSYAGKVIAAFPRRQERSGYYRSQQGEWDSNGQALWTIGQHAVHSDTGADLLDRLFDSMHRGVDWLRRKRVRADDTDKDAVIGLLPAGLSAEHLGLADFYYWDDFWALAGIRSFARICKDLGKEAEYTSAFLLAEELQADMDRALRFSTTIVGRSAIPAGPLRGLDSGMIGSLAALYPLQIISPADERMKDTLDVIMSRFFRGGMFFQDFVHSGLNTYLTLQVAHALLYRGERLSFLDMFRHVVSRASSTYAYPEAINPKTGGGIMGDGHHGWTSAEMVLILREMFVYEQWNPSYESRTLILLAGIPGEWFTDGASFQVTDVPASVGKVSIVVEVSGESVKVAIRRGSQERMQPCSCDICFPFRITAVKARRRENEGLRFTVEGAVVRLELPEGDSIIEVRTKETGYLSISTVNDIDERAS